MNVIENVGIFESLDCKIQRKHDAIARRFLCLGFDDRNTVATYSCLLQMVQQKIEMWQLAIFRGTKDHGGFSDYHRRKVTIMAADIGHDVMAPRPILGV